MIMISAGYKQTGPWAIGKKLFNQKKQIFLDEKAFFFKTEMENSTFQDAGHNLNGTPDMTYSKFDPNYEVNLLSPWIIK